MKRLRRCDQMLQAHHFANVLRAADIPCSVRNTALSSGLGDIPFLECQPEVWIDNSLDEARALALLLETSQSVDASASADSWRCQCSEVIEPQFGMCWHCGTPRLS